MTANWQIADQSRFTAISQNAQVAKQEFTDRTCIYWQGRLIAQAIQLKSGKVYEIDLNAEKLLR